MLSATQHLVGAGTIGPLPVVDRSDVFGGKQADKMIPARDPPPKEVIIDKKKRKRCQYILYKYIHIYIDGYMNREKYI